jgi:uncharacterized membrane protein YhfC
MDIFVRFLSPSLMVALGLGVGVWVVRRYGASWGLYWAGVWTFIGAQALHIPFNAYILNDLLAGFGLRFEPGLSGVPLALIGLAYGLSAGLFEELARYIVLWLWLKRVRSWRDALGFGAGHGGIEALLLGVLSVFTVIQIMSLRNTDLSTVVPPGQLELARMQIEAFWAAPWYLVLLGALERLIAIVFHLSATVLVLQAFRRKNILWLVAAIGWHTLLDASAVYGLRAWGPLWTEAGLAVFGIVSLALIYYLRDRSRPETAPPASAHAPVLDLSQAELTPEQIEESRYGS